ncbi:MAG: hypothetical protein JJE49_09880 [Peptostreptococcaceae bacterium]|nr:hypothetical protein [Peptostreptococcaceae bacterium]
MILSEGQPWKGRKSIGDADKNRIQTYSDMINRTGINWFAKQISLLNPDMIIEMNINHGNSDTLGTSPIA